MASTTGSQQASVGVPTGTWSVDPVHSTVEFQVQNMGIVWVRGLFTDFKGTVESTGEPGGVRASGTVEVASLDTRSEQRDQHLRSAEFFDLENHPRITFESTRIEPRGDTLRVLGNLTIRGVTREVELDATVQGPVDDPWGNQRVGVTRRPQPRRSCPHGPELVAACGRSRRSSARSSSSVDPSPVTRAGRNGAPPGG
jgi:polyisoprenoid-binding protein YceI